MCRALDYISYEQIDTKATGIKIKTLMDYYGYVPQDLVNCYVVGSLQAVYKWYRGESLPDTEKLLFLAKLLNVTIEELLVVKKTEGCVYAK